MRNWLLLFGLFSSSFVYSQTQIIKKIGQRHDEYITSSWKQIDSFRWYYNSDVLLTHLIALKGNTSSSWDNNYKYTYSLNTDGKVTEQLRENGSGTSWTNSTRYTYAYDASGNLLTTNYDVWNGSAWVPTGKIVDAGYNTQNKYASETLYNWNGSAWVLMTTDHYQYYPNGYLPQSIEKFTWNTSTASWDSLERLFFTFNQDSLGSRTRSIPDGTGGWLLDSREQYTYSSSPFIKTFYLSEKWDTTVSPAVWKGVKKTNYSYTTSNKLEKATTEYFVSGVWTPDNRLNYTYDASNNLVEYYDELYVTSWDNHSKKEFSYTGPNMTQELDYTWSGTWVPEKKLSYDFDANNNNIFRLIENYNGASYVFSNRDYYYYNAFTVGINEIDDTKNAYSFYPNPVSDALSITINCKNESQSQIVVSDMNGKTRMIVCQPFHTGDNSIQMSVASLPQGNYILSMIDNNSKKHIGTKFQIVR